MITRDIFKPIGLVKIYDEETGELVCETHNMIVESGRRLILKSIFGLNETKEQIISSCNTKIAAIEEAETDDKLDLINDFITFFNSKVKTDDDKIDTTLDSYNAVTTYNQMKTTGNKLKSSYSNKLVADDDLDVSHFTKFCETGSAGLTTPDMVYSDISNNILEVTGATTNYCGTQLVVDENGYCGWDADHTDNIDLSNLKMNFFFKIKNSDSIAPLTAIGLLYNGNVLFSRADINRVYMRAGRTYLCEYSIYF